jgi:hypothetical protein
MAARQLSDGNDAGTILGQSATDKVSLYGATPVVQAAHIADATDATTALTRINAILVVLENLGATAKS